MPLTPFQEALLGAATSTRDTIVARHWEQALWDQVDGPRLQAAAERVANRHSLTRARLTPENMQVFDGSWRAPLVRSTDVTKLQGDELRRNLALERDKLCLDESGCLGRPWQIHVLLTATGSAWVTVAFARVFFDRASIGLLLRDLHHAYQQPTAALSAASESPETFSSFARRSRSMPSHGASAPFGLGPELPLAAPPGPSPLFRRESLRVGAADWARVRMLAARTTGAARDPGVFLAEVCASVTALWTRTQEFTVEYVTDARRLQGLPSDSLGQFSTCLHGYVDERGDRSFAERVRDWELHLSGRSPADVLSLGNGSAQTQTRVSFSYGSPHSRSTTLGSGDRFVWVGASRPDTLLEIHADETSEGSLVVHFDHRGDLLPEGMVAAICSATADWLRLLASEEAWTFSPPAQAWRLLAPPHHDAAASTGASPVPVARDLLHSGFVRRVAEQPGHTAVIARGHALTYRELYDRACSLAWELVQRGAGRDRLVAVAMDKGWEQVVAVLGVSMAGAAYLPVDLELPQERIRFLLDHGECDIVLTQEQHRAALAELTGPRVLIAVDAVPPALPDTALPEIVTAANDLAYVIFTSGSTGTPKGVMIEHQGAVNTIRDLNDRFQVSPGDRVLALSRLSFDLSVYDIFGMLAAGGTIVMPDRDLTRDPAHWADLVREHRVTLWNTVPALMQLYVDCLGEAEPDAAATLRFVWMSGDWIPLPLPDRIRAVAPHAQVVSMGGATEASIWSILYMIGDVDPRWKSIPYGKAMLHQTFHVLRENLSPAPHHVPGELYIGGIGLARGYWKQPELTAARFIVHPHTGERLYRTGDLGRYLADGNIEFLGRADFQVKIRGFRIELGEIEAVLRSHPSVRTAVVHPRGDSDATRHLVGYVVPADRDRELPIPDLLDALRRNLPEYMVPTTLVPLPALPLTPNGKIDLKALPAPDAVLPARPPPTAPVTEVEEIILDLWREVLGIPSLGTRDDFFHSGGTSLSGTRMMIRLRSAFAIELPVECLFKNPTVQKLASEVEDRLLADLDVQHNPSQ